MLSGDYYKNRCSTPGDPNCEACEKRLPSCHGFPNGNHPFPEKPNSYITCYQNRTINIMTCEKGLYDPGQGICVEKFDPGKLFCFICGFVVVGCCESPFFQWQSNDN